MMKRQIFTILMTALTALPSLAVEPDLSFLDMPPSQEEMIVTGGHPATPETGNENPEDLLKSAPTLSTKRELPPPYREPEPIGESKPVEEPDTVEELQALEEPIPVDDLAEVTIPPEPEAVMEVAPPEGVSAKRFDRSIPPYDRENPTFGIDIHASLQALGTPIRSQVLIDGVPTGGENETRVNCFGIGFEYEPKFLQPLGVVSIGPSLNMYFLNPIGDITDSPFDIFSVGGSIKYQLKFMRSQILVPFAGFEAQMIHYKFLEETGLGSGWTSSTGPTLGVMLLLNWMEPSSAHNLFSEYSIKRSYLVAEAKYLTAGEALLSNEGTALYFGLRMEY